MPKITVKALGIFIDKFGFKRKELVFSGYSIAALFNELSKQIPEFSTEIFVDEQKTKVKGFVKILINGRGIEHLGNLEAKLKEGDIVAITPPIGGGQGRGKKPGQRRHYLEVPV